MLGIIFFSFFCEIDLSQTGDFSSLTYQYYLLTSHTSVVFYSMQTRKVPIYLENLAHGTIKIQILIFNCKFSSYFSPLLTIYIPVSMLPNCCKMTINYKNTRREMEKSLKNHPHIIVDTIIIIIITFLMQNSGVAELCV